MNFTKSFFLNGNARSPLMEENINLVLVWLSLAMAGRKKHFASEEIISRQANRSVYSLILYLLSTYCVQGAIRCQGYQNE